MKPHPRWGRTLERERRWMVVTRGVVFVHSAPAAICPHVEWAISGVTGARVSLSWTEQPAAPGSLRADASWSGRPGTGARIAGALKAWPMLRFEVTEEASPGVDGERICHVPGRGIWRAAISANGDVVLGEDQLRALLSTAGNLEAVHHRLGDLLGAHIDADLEPLPPRGRGHGRHLAASGRLSPLASGWVSVRCATPERPGQP